MSRRVWLLSLLALGLPSPLCGRAEEVRYYQKDGVTFREPRPVVSAKAPATPPTGSATASGQEALPSRNLACGYWTPVTNYVWEGYWVGRWNPFVEPYLVYRPVAVTHWELKTDTAKSPASACQPVASTVPAQTSAGQTPAIQTPAIQTVTVPTSPPRLQTVPAQTARPTAASARPTGTVRAPASVAQSSPWGGIRRLETDPPRQGTDNGWHAVNALR